MATDVVRVIQARLEEIDRELEPLRVERDKLSKALQELGERPPRPARGTRGAQSAARRRSGTPSGRSGRQKRAKHGSNVQAITEFVAAHPGATTPAIAEGTGIARSVVYSAVSRLSAAGRLVKRTSDDGQVAYTVARDD